MTQNPKQPDLTTAGEPLCSARNSPFQRNGTVSLLAGASEVRDGDCSEAVFVHIGDLFRIAISRAA